MIDKIQLIIFIALPFLLFGFEYLIIRIDSRKKKRDHKGEFGLALFGVIAMFALSGIISFVEDIIRMSRSL